MTSEETQQIVRAAMARQADGDAAVAERRFREMAAWWLHGTTPAGLVPRWERLWDDFVARQRALAEWICMAQLAERYARKKHDKKSREQGRAEAYAKLSTALQRGEFDQNGRPYVLYAVRGAAWCRLTKQKLGAFPEGDGHPDLELAHCWILREHARRWLRAEWIAPPKWVAEAREPEKPPSNLTAIDATGTPGRPTKSMHLIEPELCRRMAAGAAHRVLADEAQALQSWLIANHPGAPAPTPKTIANRIRDRHRSYRPKDPKLSTDPE